MFRKSVYLILVALCFIFSSCQHTPKKGFHQPKNLIAPDKNIKSRRIYKFDKIFKVSQESSQISWRAAKLKKGFYTGKIKRIKDGMITLKDNGKQINVAIIPIDISSMTLDSSNHTEDFLKQVKGVESYQNSGFKIDENPYMRLEIVNSYQEGDKTIYEVNLTLGEIKRHLTLTGKMSRYHDNVNLKFDPFSIDLRQWFVFFKDQNLMSPYIEFDIKLKAKLNVYKIEQ